jgi:hypothetical protein
MSLNINQCKTQNELLLATLMKFYDNRDYLKRMVSIINGESKISLRIVDWFVTNFAKKYFTVYDIPNHLSEMVRFKVYHEYKLKLKAYAKVRFDPFCRWERISIPYDDANYMETTLGQLNFFKWAIENQIIDFIETNYAIIENDMNSRNSTSRRKQSPDNLANAEKETESDANIRKGYHGTVTDVNGKTRKRREELSVSACKCIKKETVKIVVKFNE